MRYFMNWCCEEEHVEHFYQTYVFRKLELASLDLENACENMYMHVCGLDSEEDGFAYQKSVDHNMKMVKDDLNSVWDWYGDYRDWCEEEDLECQDLESIAGDCKFLGYPYGALEYVFKIMHCLYEEVKDV